HVGDYRRPHRGRNHPRDGSRAQHGLQQPEGITVPGVGEVARDLEFARDNSQRAVVQIPVDGALQAHSWEVASGRVVTATSGAARTPLITPDGQWLWWFDADSLLWW